MSNKIKKAPKRRKYQYATSTIKKGVAARKWRRNYSKTLDAITSSAENTKLPVLDDFAADKLEGRHATNIRGTQTGRVSGTKSNVTEVPRVFAKVNADTMEEALALRDQLAKALPGCVVGQPFEIDYMSVLQEAQTRFVDGFTLFYGQALEAAWKTVMLGCPIQPGAVNRQQLLEFANWFCGANAARLDRQLGVEMNNILNRIEREIITEMVRSRMQNQAKA